MAKLIKTEYILESKTVIAKVQLIIQGTTYNIDCSLQESQLLTSALESNRTDWNTSDIIKLTSDLIGQPLV